jgi:hypothetical protein
MDNSKMHIVEIGLGDVNWNGVAQVKDKLRLFEWDNEPSGSIKCCETIK